MKYEMIATIANPTTGNKIVITMSCTFSHDPNQYGNGYALHIENDRGSENYIDLRYDTDFNPDRKVSYLAHWAETNWSGKDGAYILKSVSITEKE